MIDSEREKRVLSKYMAIVYFLCYFVDFNYIKGIENAIVKKEILSF